MGCACKPWNFLMNQQVIAIMLLQNMWCRNDMVESKSKNSVERIGFKTNFPLEKSLDSFDKVGFFILKSSQCSLA